MKYLAASSPNNEQTTAMYCRGLPRALRAQIFTPVPASHPTSTAT